MCDGNADVIENYDYLKGKLDRTDFTIEKMLEDPRAIANHI